MIKRGEMFRLHCLGSSERTNVRKTHKLRLHLEMSKIMTKVTAKGENRNIVVKILD